MEKSTLLKVIKNLKKEYLPTSNKYILLDKFENEIIELAFNPLVSDFDYDEVSKRIDAITSTRSCFVSELDSMNRTAQFAGDNMYVKSYPIHRGSDSILKIPTLYTHFLDTCDDREINFDMTIDVILKQL